MTLRRAAPVGAGPTALIRSVPEAPTTPVEANPRTKRRPWLAVFAGQLGLAACGGAIGLIVGFLGLPPEIEERLPFGSTTLAGLALAVLVGVPSTILILASWRGDRFALHGAVVTGILLVGWIAIEMAFVRQFSFLQPLYAAQGCVLVFWGRAAVPDLWARVRRLPHHHRRDATGPLRRRSGL